MPKQSSSRLRPDTKEPLDLSEGRNRFTLRGKLLKYKLLPEKPVVVRGAKRGQVTGFSKASRWRMIQRVAAVNWEQAQPGLFVTLTYPDEIPIQDPYTSNMHRSVFFRYMEKHLGKNVSAFWRMEWKPRLTGMFVGYPYPHFHLIILQVKFVHHASVNSWWRSAIGWADYCRTETKGITNEKAVGAYLSKYCSKPAASLVNAAYLNSVPPGRQWGILRPNGVPWYQTREITLPDCSIVEDSFEVAANKWEDLLKVRRSYSLLGPAAAVVSAKIFGRNYLD